MHHLDNKPEEPGSELAVQVKVWCLAITAVVLLEATAVYTLWKNDTVRGALTLVFLYMLAAVRVRAWRGSHSLHARTAMGELLRPQMNDCGLLLTDHSALAGT